MIAIIIAALIAIPFSMKRDKEASILASMEETHGDKTQIFFYEATPYEEQEGKITGIEMLWLFSTLGIVGTGLYLQVKRMKK